MGCWVKIHGTHNAPIFLAREFDLPRLEKYCVFDLVVVGNGGSLILACSNVHVSKEFLFLYLVLHLVRLFEIPTGS